MAMSTATLTSKGQITIPIDVRQALGLRPGARIDFVETDTGSFEIVPASRSVLSLRGIVPAGGRRLSVEEMDDLIGEAIVGRGA